MKPISLRPRRLTGLLRGRGRSEATLAAVVAGCVALMSVVVLTGAGSPSSGVKFTQSGHWVYNSVVGRIFHLDGSTGEVDADTAAEAPEPGAQVVQTDKQGFVLSRSRIDRFGKSDLTVLDPVEPPAANEQPIGLEASGAAFAVYRQAGRVVRFGDKETIAFPGGPLGDPVVTSDGTLWVHRTGEGDLCRLPLSADRMTCPATAPKGHKGGLTAVGTGAVFVDLTAGEVFTLNNGGMDSIGSVDVPDSSLVAGNDVAGKLAIVDRDHDELHLVDVSHPDKPEAPTTTPLPKGDYDKVASSGDGIALLDRKNASLITLDRDGRQIGEATKLPSHPTTGHDKPEPNLYRGDDSRVYVENGTGDRVVVVDKDGRTEAVDVGQDHDRGGKPTTKPTDKPTVPPVKPPVKPPVTPPVNPPVTPPKPPVTSRTTPPSTHRPETPRPPGRTTPPRTPNPGKTNPRRTTPPKTTPPKTTPPKTIPPKPTARATRPGAPLNVAARIIDGGAVVSWGAAAAHGATISSYKVTWTGGGSTTVSGTTRSLLVPSLKTKTAYYFTISAVNSVGTGPAVKSAQVELKWNPAESPRELLVSKDGTSGSLTLGWMEPTMGDGTFVRYEVSMGSKTGPVRVKTTTTSAPISGLKDGTMYAFFVRAITRASDGQEVVGKYSSLSATSVGKDQPTKRVVASRGDGTTYGDDCQHPECAYLQVRIENLAPNATYSIKPYTSEWGNFNPGYSAKTSSKGQLLVPDQFPCSAVGQLTWVTVQGPGGTYTSNKFFWKADG
ncbi:fibronectin type III domain-containing protein [Kribbella sp. NPDC048928]|uniref:fibronectin type III domain-containing protein n=1 Tax=Kribbella sp. NPDC048928 TaxID=3364111 RepID=UPI00371A7857